MKQSTKDKIEAAFIYANQCGYIIDPSIFEHDPPAEIDKDKWISPLGALLFFANIPVVAELLNQGWETEEGRAFFEYKEYVVRTKNLQNVANWLDVDVPWLESFLIYFANDARVEENAREFGIELNKKYDSQFPVHRY